MVIQSLQNVVGFFAGLVTIAQMFSGVFQVIFKSIPNAGSWVIRSTATLLIPPFINLVSRSLLLLQQSRIIDDATMGIVNAFGVILNCGYLAFYYYWAKGKWKEKLIRNLKISLSLVLLIILYSMIENEKEVELRYGIIVALVILSFVAAPLYLIPQVIRKKSTEDLNFPMILIGLVVSLHWLLYSLLIWNKLLIIQNSIATLFTFIQMSFFAVYSDRNVILGILRSYYADVERKKIISQVSLFCDW